MKAKIGEVVLGLATSHVKTKMLKWQVRWVDQTKYAMIVVVECGPTFMPHSPAIENLCIDNQEEKKPDEKKFNVYSDVSHTHTCTSPFFSHFPYRKKTESSPELRPQRWGQLLERKRLVKASSCGSTWISIKVWRYRRVAITCAFQVPLSSWSREKHVIFVMVMSWDLDK